MLTFQDKWRNVSVSTSSQGSKEKAKSPKVKAVVVPSPTPVVQIASADPPGGQSAASDAVTGDASQNAQDVNHAPRYVFFTLHLDSEM